MDSEHLSMPPLTRKRENAWVAIATRTLLFAGYNVAGATRHGQHIEIDCDRVGQLGAVIRYRIAITDTDEFPEEVQFRLAAAARQDARSLVLVGQLGVGNQLGWTEFLDILGGAVPSWRALSDDFPGQFVTLARNELPTEIAGEAWRYFEEAVADAFEFILGRHVQRLGGNRRGQTVSDMIAPLPRSELLVIDAKAAGGKGFSAGWPEMRPLGEYVVRQRVRQGEHNRIAAAVLVSSTFQQGPETLLALSARFNAEFQAPVAFMPAETVLAAVAALTQAPGLRRALRWNQIFSGGLVDDTAICREIADAENERYPTGKD